MTYTAKTNWTAVDGVSAADLNRIEQGIADITTSALPATSYTAADVLTKIKTVDGSGSLLDADLLDGLQGTSYFASRSQVALGSNWNTFTTNGVYLFGDTSGDTNGPGISWGLLDVVTDGTSYVAQRVTQQLSVGTNVMYRTRNELLTWGAWQTLWHSGNTPQTRNNSGTYEWNDSGTWKAVGGVKNVQRGVASGPNDGLSSTYNVTISTVNLSKSFLTFSAVFPSGTTAAGVRVRLTSSTNIEVYSNGNNGAIVAYEVVESY